MHCRLEHRTQGQSLGPDDVVTLAGRPVLREGTDHRGGHIAGVDGLEKRVARPRSGQVASFPRRSRRTTAAGSARRELVGGCHIAQCHDRAHTAAGFNYRSQYRQCFDEARRVRPGDRPSPRQRRSVVGEGTVSDRIRVRSRGSGSWGPSPSHPARRWQRSSVDVTGCGRVAAGGLGSGSGAPRHGSVPRPGRCAAGPRRNMTFPWSYGSHSLQEIHPSNFSARERTEQSVALERPA